MNYQNFLFECYTNILTNTYIDNDSTILTYAFLVYFMFFIKFVI